MEVRRVANRVGNVGSTYSCGAAPTRVGAQLLDVADNLLQVRGLRVLRVG